MSTDQNAAEGAHAALVRASGSVLRGLIAGVPVIGNITTEFLNSAEQQETRRQLAELDGWVHAIIADLSEVRQTASEYLESPAGHRHVREIVAAIGLASHEEHRRALATAFVSGTGIGLLDPTRVELLDLTLKSLTTTHLRVLKAVAEPSNRAEPNAPGLRTAHAASVLSMHHALAQKFLNDLVQFGLAHDADVSGMTVYHGVLTVAPTAFGEDLLQYLTDPQPYHVGDGPPLRAPFPKPR